MVGRDVILIESTGSSALREMFKQRYPYPPVGILSISSFLKLHGYRTHLIDLMLEDYSRAGFAERLRSMGARPIAVGVSVYTDCFQEGIEIIAAVRQALPGTPIVVGGPHGTFRPEEVLRQTAADFVVRHEGESPIVELLEHLRSPEGLPLERIASLSYRGGDGQVHSNPPRPFLTRLDQLPFPDYDGLPALRSSYAESFLFVSSRGCPGDCIYCASRAMSGRRYRFHSAEWIFALAYEYHRRHRFHRLVFLDDTFTVDRRRARSFCRYLREAWPGATPPRWVCKSRVDTLSDEICAEIAEAGCVAVHIGVESGDQRVLDAIAKHIRLDQVFSALRAIHRHGMRADCSFIIGHHADTRETIEKTVLFAEAIRQSGLGTAVIGISTPLPGTRLLDAAAELGVEITVRNWARYTLTNPIYHTRNFTENDLRRAMLAFDQGTAGGPGGVGLTALDHREFREELARFLAELAADADVAGEGARASERDRRPKREAVR